MSVSVVLDYPRRHLLRRGWRGVGTVLGSMLYLVGLVASVAAVPLTIVVGLIALAALTNDNSGNDLPKGLVTQLWAIATAITVLGLVGGRRLVRGKRELVLFLRRFGYDEATRAVTFAAARTIGRTWRVVTLDDAEIQPVGVPMGTRGLFHTGRLGGAAIREGGKILYRVISIVCPGALAGMLGIIGIAYLRRQDLDAVIHLPSQGESLHGDLNGLFWALFAIMILGLALGVAYVLLMLLATVLSPLAGAFQSAAGAVRQAEQSKVTEIRDIPQLEAAANAVAEQSRRVFAPRLVVLKVASPVWQQTVLRIAAFSSMLLVDISEPTENLLWEIQELTEQFGSRCVVIGDHDRVRVLATDADESPALNPVVVHLSSLLRGREVLAYTGDHQGVKRFARALRNKLLTVSLSERQTLGP